MSVSNSPVSVSNGQLSVSDDSVSVSVSDDEAETPSLCLNNNNRINAS